MNEDFSELNLDRAPHYDKVRLAAEYIYFCRRHWPEGGDVVIFWCDTAGTCHRFSAARRRLNDMEMKEFVINDGVISPREFSRIKNFVLSHGILSFSGLQPARTTAHCSDLYATKLVGSPDVKFLVPGAKLGNPSANEIIDVFFGPHGGLGDFYAKEAMGEENS